MKTLAKKFKVRSGQSAERFAKNLNANLAKMFSENNANPNDYVWSYEKGLDGDDFVKDQYTVIITAIAIL